jgi:two-component sensor histidine kinase
MLYQADPERLAEEVCNTLVDSRGYTHAWVVLFQEDDTPAPEPRVRSFHHYGMAETATAFETLLRHDGPPQCIKQAIATHDLVELDTDSVVCESCPARPVYQQGRSLSRGLRHDGRLAGILTVALKPEQRDDAEERDLLVQLSNDFGFTLWAIGEQWRRRAAFRRIEELLEREKLLARELRHRVKNDFGIVRSLLALQAMRAEDDHSRNSLDEAAGRLDTMVRIQELLLDNNDAGRVDIGVLARSIAEGAGGSDGGATVTVEAHEDDLLVSSSDAGKCGIIINELLTNAEKYAGHAARIALSVSWLSPEQVQIVCRDDGAGFSRDVLDGETSGFGLDLLRGLTGGDGEELSLENGNSGGAIVTAVVGVAAGEDNR